MTRNSARIDFDRLRSILPSLEQIIRDSGVVLQLNGSRWFAHCPFHDDSTPSFSVFADGKRCGCPPCQWDGDVFEFTQRFWGLPDAGAAARWLIERYNIPPDTEPPPVRNTKRGPYVEHDDYHDASGKPLYRVIRYQTVYEDDGSVAGKTFIQGRIIHGRFQAGMQGVSYVLYRLPAVLAASTVYLCEGERDARAVTAAGGCGTCDAGGCGAARLFATRGYPETLRGKHVVIIPDTDGVGRERGAMLAHALYGIAASVRIVPLPDPCKDVRDFLEGGATLADLDALAMDYVPPADQPPPEPKRPRPTAPAAAVPDLRYFPWTDSGNAERMHAVYGDRIRWCYEMQRWLVWDENRWTVDNQHAICRLARQTMRHFAQQVPSMDEDLQKAAAAFAKKSENKAGLSNMIDLARSLHGVSVSAADLDRDPWLLNVANGTLDLRTGKLQPYTPDHLITKISPVAYNPDAQCPLFLRFLHRILDDREDLINYTQRAIGYCLTGVVSEKALFCCFGQGNNGKTTLLELFRWLLGDYAAQVMIDTLMTKAAESNNTLADLADLRGARFVTTSEAEENHRLSEGKIKYLTGMGEVKTCRKYENPIAFMPTHKIWMDANHRPIVRGTDKAIWNRLKPIGFTVTIPDAEIDRELSGKLQAEAEGILAWAVYGCLDWQRDGLGALGDIQDETNRWKAENDPLKDFLEDWCTVDAADSELYTRVNDLRRAYEKWAEDEGERFTLTRTKFRERLEMLGLKYAIRRWKNGEQWNSERVWYGIGIKRSV